MDCITLKYIYWGLILFADGLLVYAYVIIRSNKKMRKTLNELMALVLKDHQEVLELKRQEYLKLKKNDENRTNREVSEGETE